MFSETEVKSGRRERVERPGCGTVTVKGPRWSTGGPLLSPRSTSKTCLCPSEPPRTRTWNLEIKSPAKDVAEPCTALQIPLTWTVFSAPACGALRAVAFPVVSEWSRYGREASAPDRAEQQLTS